MSSAQNEGTEPEPAFDEPDEPEPVDEHWSAWGEIGFTGAGAGHDIGA